jgi:hypothetical protein
MGELCHHPPQKLGRKVQETFEGRQGFPRSRFIERDIICQLSVLLISLSITWAVLLKHQQRSEPAAL